MRLLKHEAVQGSVEGVCIEAELAKSRNDFQTLFNLMPDPVVIIDSKGKFLEVNDRVEETTGFEKEELLGKNFLSTKIVTKKSKAILAKNLAKRMLGMYVIPYEVEVLTKDGRKLPFEINAKKIEYEGKPADLVILRDIIQRKKAEEALRESEEKFRNVAEQSPNMIFINKKSKVVYTNKRSEEVMGYKREEFYSPDFDFLTLIAPQSKDIVKASFSKHMKDEDVTPYEYTLLTREGKRIEAIITTKLIGYEGESAILGIVTDITERKQIEKALRESEKRFRQFFENEPEYCYMISPEGKILDINMNALKALGYNKKEIIGKPFLTTIYAPSSHEKAERLFVKWKKIGRLRNEELNIITRRGEERIVLLSADSVKDAKGKLLHSISVQRDITERKRMEEKLRQYSEHLEELVQKRTEDLLESETRYSVLVEEANDGVAILQDEKIVFINKSLLEISGYSRDELIGIPFAKIAKMVDEKYRQVVKERHERRIRGEENPATSELELIAKTGERIPIEASSAIIHHSGHPAVLTIVRDIRERKRMEEQRLRLEKLAAVGEVATMVGHDLRNPLQSIENATYYLNNELSHLQVPQKTMEMLQVINDSVDYADKIIRDLQDFSAVRKPTLKNNDINAIVKEVLSQVETQENMEFITKLGHLPEIKADKDMMKRVFLNLAINGLQAIKEKGGRLKVSTKKTKESVEITFEDTGTGISKENKEKIFTPFFTTRAKGMGMGLAICKKFVESQGGSIEVESKEGKGSTFTVILPVQLEDGDEKQ